MKRAVSVVTFWWHVTLWSFGVILAMSSLKLLTLKFLSHSLLCLSNWNPHSTFFFPFPSCSVAQSCLTLCDPVDCSPPGFPVLHYLPKFAQTHVHRVGDVIQPSHPLSPPSPLALSLSQHQGLFLNFKKTLWIYYLSTLVLCYSKCFPSRCGEGMRE